MWSATCVILLISVTACVADQSGQSKQCNETQPFDHIIYPFSCCKIPTFKRNIESCMNHSRQVILNRNSGNPETTDVDISADEGCLANCLSSTYIFRNDEINRNELIKVLETQTVDSAWTDVHSAAVDKCIEMLQPDLKNMETVKGAQRCNRIWTWVAICLNRQYLAMCPDTHFKNDTKSHRIPTPGSDSEIQFIVSAEKCKKFQEHIRMCPMPNMTAPVTRSGKKIFGDIKGGSSRQSPSVALWSSLVTIVLIHQNFRKLSK